MKKIFLILSVVSVLSVIGCTKQVDPPPPPPPTGGALPGGQVLSG
ncbi:MAG: hypothetical protein U0U70_06005 [Chitinophagaceae bacterium]